MSCENIPSLQDLQKAKLNADDFGRLMGTGTGTSTNGVTGQVRPTYNKVINDMNSEFDGMITGMNSEFDAQILNMGFTRVGTFASGATIANPRQTLLWDIADGGDGQEYGWSGAFPPSGKVVPPGSTPLTTGGIAVGAWMSRFDPALRVQTREALRRSYAEAGYNLVDGSFEAGGTLVNANDVLLQERTGKGFSGPAGTVAAGTNPASGGFVDKSGSVQDFIDGINAMENRLTGAGSEIYRGSNSQYVQNGDTVPSGTTHLIVLINGKAENVAMSPIASGVVSLLTETGATIGGSEVSFRFKYQDSGEVNIWQYENFVNKNFSTNPDDWSWDAAYAQAIKDGLVIFPNKLFYRYHKPIIFPAWDSPYCFDSGIEKKESGIIRGHGSGIATGERAATTLKFRHTDKPCFTNNRSNTLWGMLDPDGNAGFGADGSIYEGFLVEGSTENSSFSDNHGVAMRSRAIVRYCQFVSLGGNGVHIHAASNGDAVTLGNANNWLVDSIRCVRVHHGLFVKGYDANAGASRMVDASRCRGFGILDESFLGNTHSEVHTASCGSGGKVSYGETSTGSGVYNCYQCIDEKLAGTTYPGTDDSVWWFMQESSNLTEYPAFELNGTYYDGGSVKSKGLNSANLWNGVYTEGGQLGPILSQRDASIGGLKGSPINYDLSSSFVHIVDGGAMRGSMVALPKDGNQYVQVMDNSYEYGEIRRIQRKTPSGVMVQTWELAKDSGGHTEVGYGTANTGSISVGIVRDVSSATDNARNGDAKLGRIYTGGFSIDQRSTPISGQYYKVGDRLLLTNGNVLICSVAGLGGSTAVFGKQIVATTV